MFPVLALFFSVLALDLIFSVYINAMTYIIHVSFQTVTSHSLPPVCLLDVERRESRERQACCYSIMCCNSHKE